MEKDELGNPAMYLGDGAYAVWERNQGWPRLRLTAGSHRVAEAQHVIYLEPEVLVNLEIFLAEIRKRIAP